MAVSDTFAAVMQLSTRAFNNMAPMRLKNITYQGHGSSNHITELPSFVNLMLQSKFHLVFTKITNKG